MFSPHWQLLLHQKTPALPEDLRPTAHPHLLRDPSPPNEATYPLPRPANRSEGSPPKESDVEIWRSIEHQLEMFEEGSIRPVPYFIPYDAEKVYEGSREDNFSEDVRSPLTQKSASTGVRPLPPPSPDSTVHFVSPPLPVDIERVTSARRSQMKIEEPRVAIHVVPENRKDIYRQHPPSRPTTIASPFSEPKQRQPQYTVGPGDVLSNMAGDTNVQLHWFARQARKLQKEAQHERPRPR